MFVLYMYGDGGCDYSMGCNLRVRDLKAKTLAEAQAEAAGMISDADHYGVDTAILYEVSAAHNIDIKALKKKWQEESEAEEAEAEAEIERATYEALKKKFEGK